MTAAQMHGPADEPHFVPGRGWVRSCLCGREFVSEQDWQHVPKFYDHLATVPAADVYVDAPVGITLDCEPRACCGGKGIVSDQEAPSAATLRWHYEDGTWWAESPEFPEWSGGASSLDEARFLAHEGLRLFAENDALTISDPFGKLPASVTT